MAAGRNIQVAGSE